MKKICSVEGCGRKHLARGLCGKHYDRWWDIEHPGYGTVVKRKWRESHPNAGAEAMRRWRDKHPGCNAARGRDWTRSHPGYSTATSIRWYKNHPLERTISARKYRFLHSDRIRKRVNQRFKVDVQFRLRELIRSRFRKALRQHLNGGKTVSAVGDLGCSISYLVIHIEKQFQEGMTWNNWGAKRNSWSIDHIVPLSKFDLANKKEALKAVHYTNLRPMWHIDNIKKGDKIIQ